MQERSRITVGGWRLLWRLRRALLTELHRASPGLFWALVLATVLPGLLAGAVMVCTGIVVGNVPDTLEDGLASPAGDRVITGVIVVVVLYALQTTLTPIRASLCDVLGRRLEGRLRERVMRAVLAPPGIAHLERADVLDRVSMAQTVGIGETRPRSAVTAAAKKYSDQLQGFVAAGILAVFAWWLPVLLVTAWALLRFAWIRKMRDSVQLNALQTRALRRSSYFRDLALTPPAARETRVFGLDRWLVDRFVTQWTQAMTLVWRERRTGGPLLWLSIFAVAGAHLLAFTMLGRSAALGDTTLGALATFVQAVFITEWAATYDSDHKIDSGSRPILATTELAAEVVRPEFRLSGTAPVDGLPAQVIRFEGVRFRYPGRTEDVFTDLDLEIPTGRSLAIVGENGAGKTTLVKLLARLYDPTGGRITVDGTDLRHLDPTGWAGRVAAIFQDFVQYHLSVADNIGFGALDLAGDHEALVRAAKRAGAADVIEALPHGWDTVLSREYANGTDLSGGQWQRIALARALLAVEAGAGVLVLDEPTAHLDPRAEADFYDRFLDLTRGRTTLVISHRFSTVRRADRIVVLDHGRVVEQGSHDELLALRGRYAAMFTAQAARFAEPPPLIAEPAGGPLIAAPSGAVRS